MLTGSAKPLLLSLLSLLSGLLAVVQAQTSDQQLDVVFRTNIGSETPFWLQSNRYDLIPSGSAAQLGLRYFGAERIAERTAFVYGAELYGRTDGMLFDRPIHQAFVGLSHGNWLLSIGQREETVGVVQPKLSAGPTIWSGNARPMPKIKLALREFTSLPLTDGWVSVK